MTPISKTWLQYFRSPFPGTQGFSSYRFPGVLVHLPVWAAFLLLGVLLCDGHTWLWTLLPFYFMAGFYIGRDLAIYAHYNPLITLAVFLAFILFPYYGNSVLGLIKAVSEPCSGIFSFAISVGLILLFYFYLRRWCEAEE
jgi:prepilin signal peptidase PulO-like enzyme (type II secretory pathway)